MACSPSWSRHGMYAASATAEPSDGLAQKCNNTESGLEEHGPVASRSSLAFERFLRAAHRQGAPMGQAVHRHSDWKRPRAGSAPLTIRSWLSRLAGPRPCLQPRILFLPWFRGRFREANRIVAMQNAKIRLLLSEAAMLELMAAGCCHLLCQTCSQDMCGSPCWQQSETAPIQTSLSPDKWPKPLSYLL